MGILGGSTSLMRAAIGDIVQAAGGSKIVPDVLDECRVAAQKPMAIRRGPSSWSAHGPP
jgi:hypothetical protein